MSESNGANVVTDLLSQANADRARLSNERARLAKTVTALRQLLGVATRDQIESAVRDLVKLKEEHALTAKERDELKARLGKPDEKDQRIEELTKQIRTREFQDVFRTVFKELGGNETRANDLLKLSDLSPPSEGEIRPELFTEFLEGAKGSHPWAFGEPTPPAVKPVPGGGATQPPGSGRSPSAPASGPVRYTRDMINEVGWEKKHPELVNAFQEGRATLAE